MRCQAHRTSNATPSRYAVLSLLAAACLWCACGGGGGGTMGAAGSQPLPMIGAPCTVDCMTGLVCERSGAFAGQCTAGCGSGAGCQLLAPNTACFGMGASAQCGVLCTSSAECPTGTSCQAVGSMLGCRLAATPMP